MNKKKKRTHQFQTVRHRNNFFFQLIAGSTALEFTWTQISEPLGQYLGIPYPSTQLTPSNVQVPDDAII